MAVVGGRGTLNPSWRGILAALALLMLTLGRAAVGTSLDRLADDAAPTLTIPSTKAGDSGMFREPKADGASIILAFGHLGPHPLTDASGRPALVQAVVLAAPPGPGLDLPSYVAYATAEGPAIASATTHLPELADRRQTQVGTQEAGYTAVSTTWQARSTLHYAMDARPAEEGWCGLRPQATRSLDLSSAGPLFPACRAPFAQDPAVHEFAVTGRGHIGPYDVVRFEALDGLTVYLSPQTPFPVRWEVPTEADTVRVLDLEVLPRFTFGIEGVDDLRPARWTWNRADLSGPADPHHNLTLAQADAAVRAHAESEPTAFLRSHPEARVVGGAFGSQRQFGYSTDRVGTDERMYWALWYSDGKAHETVCVEGLRRESDYASTPLPDAWQAWPVKQADVKAGCMVDARFRGSLIPEGQSMPTLASIEASWGSYFPPDESTYFSDMRWAFGEESGTPTLAVERCRYGYSQGRCETLVVDEAGHVRRLEVAGTFHERAITWLGALVPLRDLPLWHADGPASDAPAFEATGARTSAAIVAWNVGLWVTLVAGGLALVALAWDALRAGLAPLLSRVSADPLAHPARQALLQEVETTPGIHFRELMRRARLGRSATDHHLRKLQAAGLLVSSAGPGYLCFFRAGRHDRRETAAGPWLKSEGARRALHALMGRPQATSVELAAELGVDPATARHHLGRLQAAGLASADADGRRTRWSATDAAHVLRTAATPMRSVNAEAPLA